MEFLQSKSSNNNLRYPATFFQSYLPKRYQTMFRKSQWNYLEQIQLRQYLLLEGKKLIKINPNSNSKEMILGSIKKNVQIQILTPPWSVLQMVSCQVAHTKPKYWILSSMENLLRENLPNLNFKIRLHKFLQWQWAKKLPIKWEIKYISKTLKNKI